MVSCFISTQTESEKSLDKRVHVTPRHNGGFFVAVGTFAGNLKEVTAHKETRWFPCASEEEALQLAKVLA